RPLAGRKDVRPARAGLLWTGVRTWKRGIKGVRSKHSRYTLGEQILPQVNMSQQQQQQQHASLVAAFVIDTSASMSQKTSDGRSLLDHAKDMVEQLTVKSRHTPAHHVLLTNCLLLTTEEWPANIKTSWADWGDKPEKRLAR
ncbi:unnamed protein product, partial [Ectocarpus sp. 12 AP-2014]